MVASRDITNRRGAYKLWFDLTILILAHVFLLPLWISVWVTITLVIWLEDRGPIFYRQKRVGKNGRVFTILKFRTMVPNADQRGPAWTTEGDPRVTRTGRFLRRTALDELPEIYNIWRRDMSLVGPRALGVGEQQELEQEVPGFAGRLQTLPGLTGLAQVYDLEDDADDKCRYDLEYVQRMSPWLDFKILIISVRNTLMGRWDRRSGKPREAAATPAEQTQVEERQETPS